MPKLIMRDRQLGVVARQLVTDANGAPCCCGGVCCPETAPCLPTPYLACNAGGLIVRATCPANRGYRMRATSSWQSLLRTRQTNVVITDPATGRQRLVGELVSVIQFGLTATADYCVSSDPGGAENEIARLISGTMQLQGATFQTVTADGGSMVEYVASGQIIIPEGPAATSDLLPVVNEADRYRPVVVELLRPGLGIVGVGSLHYPVSAAGGNGGTFNTSPSPNLSMAPGLCSRTWAPNRWTTEQHRYEDACIGGRLIWSTATENAPGSPGFSLAVVNYTASLDSTWTREYCGCGGGGPTELTGGGCSNCGDRSQLEVIE